MIAAGIVLGGCGGARHAAPAPASTSSATASTSASPSAAPGAEALAAYRGMWADWVAVALTSDYEDPQLTQHVSGHALSTIYRAVGADQHRGLVSRGTPTFSPRVAALSPSDAPSRVTIDDCADDSKWLHYDGASGKLEDDVPGGRHRVQALVLKAAGSWKVDELVIQPVGTC